MITVNGIIVGDKHFPDGTLMMLDFDRPMDINGDGSINIVWKYENDAELFTLICVVGHIRNNGWGDKINLLLPYIPNARMDRVKEETEVFTLKYFCKVINSLNLNKVYVLDPHSYVSEALLDRMVKIDPQKYIGQTLDDIEGINIDGGEKYKGTTVIYFPDAGAMKRYRGLDVFCGRPMIYGEKNRDWKTGEITGLSIYSDTGTPLAEFGDKPLNDKVVLMIDDIISYGGTLAYSTDELRKLGASAVYAYASHTENSLLNEEKGKLLKRMVTGALDELFTTNSIFKYEHPRVYVFEDF